jgi:hypothetical protein
MEATIQQRQYQSKLNQGRQENAAQKTMTASDIDTDTSPNFVVGAFMLIVAVVADIGGAIPIVGWFIAGPALGIIWLWRIFSHQTGPKKDPTFQLLSAFGAKIIPFPLPTYTTFVLYAYGKDTKLGKATIGKAEKLAKVT